MRTGQVKTGVYAIVAKLKGQDQDAHLNIYAICEVVERRQRGCLLCRRLQRRLHCDLCHFPVLCRSILLWQRLDGQFRPTRIGDLPLPLRGHTPLPARIRDLPPPFRGHASLSLLRHVSLIERLAGRNIARRALH